VQDAGGGAIHTTLTPDVLQSLAAKSQRVIFAHTSQSGSLARQANAAGAANVEFAHSGHITGIGAAIPRAAEAERVETLSACPLFARLPVAERMALAQKVSETQWQPGQVIVREGERPDGQTYIVHAGLVEVWSGEDLLRVLGRGNSIGERGALQGEVRTVTLKARGSVELLSLSAELFGPIAEALGLRAAFTRADWLWGHPTFGHLPWATLLDLALDFQSRAVQTGDILFHYGDPGYECYLLISGGVGIFDKDGEALGELSTPGEFFGGRAALFGTPRNASAQVISPGEVWALPAPALHRLQTVYPNVLLHLRVVEANRRGERPFLTTL
jgi:CRP-like cAMP-binding protein